VPATCTARGCPHTRHSRRTSIRIHTCISQAKYSAGAHLHRCHCWSRQLHHPLRCLVSIIIIFLLEHWISLRRCIGVTWVQQCVSNVGSLQKDEGREIAAG
jgi:hypothetical protein